MVQLSEIQETMIGQIKSLNPLYRFEYGIKQIVKVKEDTLRFCLRVGRKKINFDITLDTDQDLYNVKAYDIDKLEKDLFKSNDLRPESYDRFVKASTVLEGDGFFWDQLDDLMRQSLK